MQGFEKVTVVRPRLADLVYEQIVGGLKSGVINPSSSAWPPLIVILPVRMIFYIEGIVCVEYGN